MRILALDQGTTSTKAYLWHDGAISLVGRRVHRQIRPHPGWVEHDRWEIAAHLDDLIQQAGPVDAAGLANQGETVIAWHAETKEPLHNAIVWQDERTTPAIEQLRSRGVEQLTFAKAGLPLDAYFSASKLRWLLDHADGAQALLRQGKLRLGTSDAYWLDRLTGCAATDPATASRTSLLDLRALQWDPALCAAFGVPLECLPHIRPNTGYFGALANGAPIVASIVDQQASLFGHGCRRPGDIKITFGTGAFALGLTGDIPPPGTGLLPTCAWQCAGSPARYALDGAVLAAGSVIEWLRETNILTGMAALDQFDGPTAIGRGLAFVPALAGLGSPHWDRTARGAWFGLGFGTSQADLCRAVLEGIAFRAAEVTAALAPTGSVAIDGGLSRSHYFTQFLANVLGRPLRVATTADVTARGVLHLCLTSAGIEPEPVPWQPVEPQTPLAPELRAKFTDAIALARRW